MGFEDAQGNVDVFVGIDSIWDRFRSEKLKEIIGIWNINCIFIKWYKRVLSVVALHGGVYRRSEPIFNVAIRL